MTWWLHSPVMDVSSTAFKQTEIWTDLKRSQIRLSIMCVQESNVCKYGRRIRVSIVDESKRQANLNKFKGLEYL